MSKEIIPAPSRSTLPPDIPHEIFSYRYAATWAQLAPQCLALRFCTPIDVLLMQRRHRRRRHSADGNRSFPNGWTRKSLRKSSDNTNWQDWCSQCRQRIYNVHPTTRNNNGHVTTMSCQYILCRCHQFTLSPCTVGLCCEHPGGSPVWTSVS